MPDTWSLDARHYPDSDEELQRLPGPVLSLALFVRSIITWVTSRPVGVPESSNVNCRRHPRGKRCVGEIVVLLDEHDTIEWECPICGDHGFIRGWRGTSADRSSWK